MASLKQYFETNASHTITLNKQVFTSGARIERSLPIRLHYDLDACVMYISMFFNNELQGEESELLSKTLEMLQVIIAPQGITQTNLPRANFGFSVTVENMDTCKVTVNPNDGSSESNIDITKFPFSNKIFVYCEDKIKFNNQLLEHVKMSGMNLVVRGERYLNKIMENMKPKAFVSHDSRDKTEIARPIASQLQSLMCPVWYDEYSLSVGDSLRGSIEKGLKESEYCILILTPNFLGKNGWTKREFDSVFTRELLEDRNVILPIWHNVTARDVFEYSPILADRLGLSFELGIDTICSKLYSKIMDKDS